MSLLGVIFRASSGLDSFTQGLENLSNNVSNVNTVGYKSNEMQFSEIEGDENFDSSLGENDGSEIGQGVKVSGGNVNYSQGDVVFSGNATDLAIDGEGFFILESTGGKQVYTRAGQFELDEKGYLIDPESEYRVQMLDSFGRLSDINMRSSLISSPIASTRAQLSGSLDSTAAEGTKYPAADSSDKLEIQVFDENGEKSVIYVEFTKQLGNSWRVDYLNDDGVIIAPHHTLTFGTEDAPTFDTITDEITFELFSFLSDERVADDFDSGTAVTVDVNNIAATALTDMQINNGQFIIRDGESISYSSTGTYQLNVDGFLVDSSSGQRLAGVSSDGVLEDIQMDLTSGALETTAVVVNGSFYEDTAIGSTISLPASNFTVYDADGNTYTIELQFTRVPTTSTDRREFDVVAVDGGGNLLTVDSNLIYIRTGSNAWELISSSEELRVSYDDGAGTSYQFDANFAGDADNSGLSLDSDITNDMTVNVVDGRLEGDLQQFSFTDDGQLLLEYSNGVEETLQQLALIERSGSQITDLTVDFSAVSTVNSSGASNVQVNDVDGRSTGQLLSFEFAESGEINLVYSNDDKKEIGSVALALFADSSVLHRAGNAAFESSDNSQRTIGSSSDPMFGTLKAQSLELSNVDLSSEFADIIIVQRGFQASSQVLNVTNELIEELYNSTSGR